MKLFQFLPFLALFVQLFFTDVAAGGSTSNQYEINEKVLKDFVDSTPFYASGNRPTPEKTKYPDQTPFTDIHFEILRTASLEKIIKYTLKEASNTLHRTWGHATYLFTMIPTFGGMIMGLANAATDKSSVYNTKLAQAIVNTAERADLQNNIIHFTSGMKLVDRTLIRIANNQTISEDAELADVRRELEFQIENFASKITLYKKYPILSVNSLFFLHVYVLAFEAVLERKKPHLAKHSKMACDLHEILLEYRGLAVEDRLNMIEVSGTHLVGKTNAKEIKSAQIPKILSTPYNANGYFESSVKTIDCKRITSKKNLQVLMYIKEGDDGPYLINKDPKHFEKCLVDYMKFGRQQVERIFEDPLKMVERICTAKTKPIPSPKPKSKPIPIPKKLQIKGLK